MNWYSYVLIVLMLYTIDCCTLNPWASWIYDFGKNANCGTETRKRERTKSAKDLSNNHTCAHVGEIDVIKDPSRDSCEELTPSGCEYLCINGMTVDRRQTVPLGCFLSGDNNLSRLFLNGTSWLQNDVEFCIQTCSAGGLLFAGVEAGSWCWCGNSVKRKFVANSTTACNRRCPNKGKDTRFCGGVSHVQVYCTAPDPCASSPCKFGKCVRSEACFLCKCDNGYTGEYCELEIEPIFTFDTKEPLPMWDGKQSAPLKPEVFYKLMQSNNYSSSSSPNQICNGKTHKAVPTRIGVSVHIQTISLASESNTAFVWEMFISTFWNDNRLSMLKMSEVSDQTGYVQLTAKLDRNLLWLPSVYYPNSPSVIIPTALEENNIILLTSAGTVVQTTRYRNVETCFRVIVTPDCAINLRMYPFDKQSCFFLIGMYKIDNNQAMLEWREPLLVKPPLAPELGPVSLGPDVQMTSFTISQPHLTTDDMQNFERNCDVNHRCLAMTIEFSRQYSFQLVDVFFPTFATAILSWLSLFIRNRSEPTRMQMCLINFMSSQFSAATVRNRLPPVPYLKLVDIWLFACQGAILICALEFVLIGWSPWMKVFDKPGEELSAEERELEERSWELEKRHLAKVVDLVTRVCLFFCLFTFATGYLLCAINPTAFII